MSRVGDALIQTNRSADLRLQLRVTADFIPLQRLLHHKQVESVQLSQMKNIGKIVSGVGINREQDFGKLLSDGGDEFKIFPRFDFQLDTLIAAFQFLLYLAYEALRRFANAQRDATRNLLPCS